VDQLSIFLDGIEAQLEWHSEHVCPDCPTIQTMSENLVRIRDGLERLKALNTDGAFAEEEIQETLREAGEFLVFFGPLSEKVTLAGCRLTV